MKAWILSLIIAIFMLFGCRIVFADEALDSGWLSYKAGQMTIIYPADINLRKLESRLRSRWFTVSSTERDLYSNQAYPIEKRILARLESILLRTKQVLTMYPNIELKIKIFRNRDELSREYLRLLGSQQRYKSFYIHGFQTIYSSMQDISDSEIAHEMAHAIIDSYFRVIPPEKTAELLATYVDSHLEKD